MSRSRQRSSPKLLPGAAAVVAATFATQAAMVLGSVLSARVLGVEQRGSLALFAAIPVVTAQVALLGLPLGIAYALARRPEDGGRIRRVVAEYLPLPALAAAIVAAALLPVVDRSLAAAPVLILVAVLAIAFAWHLIALAFLEGLQVHRLLAGQRLLPALAYSGAVAALIVAGQGTLLAFCAAYAATWLLAAAVAWRIASRRLARAPARNDGPNARALLSFGARSVGQYLSPVETFRVDLVAVGMFFGPYQLGLYVAGTTFAVLPRLLAQSLGVVAYPAIAAANDRSRAVRLIGGFAVAVAVGVAAIAVVVIQAATLLVETLFGTAFLPAVPILAILQVAGALVGVRQILVTSARGLGRPGVDGIAELLSLPVLALGMGLAVVRQDALLVGVTLVAAYGLQATIVAAFVASRLARPWEPRVPSPSGTTIGDEAPSTSSSAGV